jgi:hypothetical protein
LRQFTVANEFITEFLLEQQLNQVTRRWKV